VNITIDDMLEMPSWGKQQINAGIGAQFKGFENLGE
jgi:hypothetical protein